MKKLLVLFMVCCLFTACGKKEEVNVNVTEQTKETEEVKEETAEEVTEGEAVEETIEEVAETVTEGAVISPLPTTIDMNALNDCTLAVSFEEGDAYVDDTGAMQLEVTVYTYDLYDMVDIANLKVGDTMMIQGNEVLVESLETLESGLVFINGGMENGGYDLWHNESGVYFEHGFNDAKSYYSIGEAKIKVSPDFEFSDSSDPEKGEVIYYPGDFLIDDAGIIYQFTPNNTSIVIEDGEVIAMTRIYTP